MNDDMPKYKSTNEEYGEYKPVPFIPSNPYDSNASQCNLTLKQEGSEKVIVTEEGEIIEDQTIVECRYDITRQKGWQWIPLRVRYDKTAEYRRGEKNFGNAYHVAESVWRSIHQPVTETMVTTGRDIPPYVGEYSETPLNTFEKYIMHVLFRVSQPGDTLISFDVGSASLLPEWIHRKLSFVFGIDESRNNLFHRIHGACANYLNAHKRYKSLPMALFAQANLERPWTESFYTERGVQMSQALFGKGAKDRKLLGEMIYKNYGIAQEGFQITKQTDIGYHFREKQVLDNFMKTLQKVSKKSGLFIGTCLDGLEVFNSLKNSARGESINGDSWRIQKDYDADEFPQDETGLGYKVIIHDHNGEKNDYLVNFEYFKRIMENNGFILLNNVNELGIPKSSGTFRDMYQLLSKEVKTNSIKTLFGDVKNLSSDLKDFMMYYRYFIFIKQNDVENYTENTTKRSRKTIRLKKTK
jgi:hypothetical protein